MHAISKQVGSIINTTQHGISYPNTIPSHELESLVNLLKHLFFFNRCDGDFETIIQQKKST